jgi:hypothetical protein
VVTLRAYSRRQDVGVLREAVMHTAPCSPYVGRRLGGTYRRHLSQPTKKPVYSRWLGRHVPPKRRFGFYIAEDGILYSQRRENLKSYIALTDWPL